MAEGTQEQTWTQHVFRCLGCGHYCYASQEAIDQIRTEEGHGLDISDAAIVEGIEFCLSCITGRLIDAERAPRPSGHRGTMTSIESQSNIDGANEWLKGAVWELRSLTPTDVRILEAAMSTLVGFAKLEQTVGKVQALVASVKSAGVWPDA